MTQSPQATSSTATFCVLWGSRISFSLLRTLVLPVQGSRRAEKLRLFTIVPAIARRAKGQQPSPFLIREPFHQQTTFDYLQQHLRIHPYPKKLSDNEVLLRCHRCHLGIFYVCCLHRRRYSQLRRKSSTIPSQAHMLTDLPLVDFLLRDRRASSWLHRDRPDMPVR